MIFNQQPPTQGGSGETYSIYGGIEENAPVLFFPEGDTVGNCVISTSDSAQMGAGVLLVVQSWESSLEAYYYDQLPYYHTVESFAQIDEATYVFTMPAANVIITEQI